MKTVANDHYDDCDAQQIAVIETIREELAISETDGFPGGAALEEFRSEMRPELFIQAGAPIPWLEENRPAWASRRCDQDRHAEDDDVSDAAVMSWRSEPVSIPLARYYGRWRDDGHFESARLMLDLRQNVTSRDPRIAFERHGYKLVKGETRVVDGEDHYEISVDEAVRLARALLLLADVARGTADTIADRKPVTVVEEAS
ncbi:hypothetical protein [Rhodococcus zopfii]|uniref:hypothetical protein n=1 Tax=Rhodococcus zopfii TaxID=43772 RepID=UPI0011114278|nr:hypothetical protein [Rhodococcus zopfii]